MFINESMDEKAIIGVMRECISKGEEHPIGLRYDMKQPWYKEEQAKYEAEQAALEDLTVSEWKEEQAKYKTLTLTGKAASQSKNPKYATETLAEMAAQRGKTAAK